MSAVVSAADVRRSRVRLFIVTMLFLVTTVNYADRATLSIAGPALSKELHLDPVAMGWIFSAFGWSYVIAQVPGGWLLDRYGSRLVYAFSIIVWSLFTLMQGWVGFLSAGAAIVVLFALRLLVGVAEAPSFPANARIVAAWFPGNERGTASAFFNSGQYFATVIFAPLMGWIAHDYGWRYVFFVMGALGVIMGLVWIKTIYGPKEHPGINEAEFDYIKEGGALVDLDAPKEERAPQSGSGWDHIRQLLSNRMMLGVYLGQYCINTLTYFFLTWFPVYLVKERGLSILQAGFVATLRGAVRLHRRCARRHHLGRDPAQHRFADHGAQDSDRRRHAAVDVDHRLQLCRRTCTGGRLHGARLLRQGHRRARLGCRLRHLAEGSRRRLRRPVQHLRQPLLDHHPDRDRLHPGRDRLLQWRAAVRRRQCAGRRVRLSRRGGQDRAGGAQTFLLRAPAGA
ncbi:MFS family permease [Bradyrhizobium diazoefficiens]